MAPRALVAGCAGPALPAAERALLRDCDPWGFILFARNCRTPQQVRRLVADLREAVGRDAPVFVDQEGGRVARLGPPHWEPGPPPAVFGALYGRRRAAALEAVRLNAWAQAADLRAAGIDANCVPVLDMPAGPGGVIGDRAYGRDPDAVSALGRACADGCLAAGVLPVIKHVPGHGRAVVDSHHARPRVTAPLAALEAHDIVPFRALADLPLAMTAHVVYAAVDPVHPATVSAAVIAEVVRGRIGFGGLLLSDDLSMAALSGDIPARGLAALAAGCDVVLHCNGNPEEIAPLAAVLPRLEGSAAHRASVAQALRGAAAPDAVQAAAMRRQVQRLLADG